MPLTVLPGRNLNSGTLEKQAEKQMLAKMATEGHEQGVEDKLIYIYVFPTWKKGKTMQW